MPLRALRLSKSLGLLLGVLMIVSLSAGCDPDRSVNPFYRPQDVIFDASLLGSWRGTDSSENGRIIVKARTIDSYTLELTQADKNEKKETCWTFEAHLFKYQQELYMDLLPTAFRVRGRKEKFQAEANDLEFLVPVHTAMRIDHDDVNLSFSWNGGGEMSSFFKNEDEASREKRLAREKRQRDILAMSTEQLQLEVLGAPPDGDTVVEMGMHFTRNK
jgi:hypothetical protein